MENLASQGAFVHTSLIRDMGLPSDKLELENELKTMFQQRVDRWGVKSSRKKVGRSIWEVNVD